jgi:protein farnesyltransferase/geranylgeranyltransferase type-1 subunit alpha
VACGGGPKTLKEIWRIVNETSLPLRAAAVPVVKGPEEEGLSVKAFEARWERKVRLTCSDVASRCFREKREREGEGRERRGLGRA